MAEAEEYAGGDEDVAAAEQEEDVDEVSAAVLWTVMLPPRWLVWESGSGLYGRVAVSCMGE